MDKSEGAVRILVAEDSPTQAEQLKSLLERRGYLVSVAGNGLRALELLGERKPDLVISDIMMPDLDGYGLCRRIRGDARLAELPVVLLTALTNAEDVLEGLSCGADGFLSKPYNEDYLLEQVAQILAESRKEEDSGPSAGVEITLGGKKHIISAEGKRMLTLLISTYEAAIRRSAELSQTQDELQALNDNLEDLVAARTAALSAEIAERKHAEAAMADANAALREALEKIKVLNNLLPICAKCKMIRDEKGEWKPIEEYISMRTDTEFTHGICPICAKELYSGYTRT